MSDAGIERRAPAAPPRLALWGALVAVLVLAGLLSWRKNLSLDLGFHLATGRIILDTGRWPANDPFTYTLGDHRYVTMNSLFQVAVALSDRLAGPTGMNLLRLLLVAATLLVAWRHAIRRGVRSPPLLILGFTAAIFAWGARFYLRPELVSWLELALFLYLLRRHAEDGRSRWLRILIPLQILWTWSHTLSVLGPALAALYAFCGLIDRRACGRLPWIVALLCAAALFANPYGIAGVRDLWLLRTRLQPGSIWKQSIAEVVSPFALPHPIPWPVRWFEILLIVGAATLAARRRSFSLFDLSSALLFAYLAVTAVRNVPLFVLGSLPLTLAATQQLLDLLRARRPALFRLGSAPLAASLSLVAVLCATIVSGAYYLHDHGGSNEFGAGDSPARFPIRCVDRMEALALPGPVYNVLNFGGYLIGRLWPQRKVFIDGRLEVIDEGFYRQSISIQQGLGWPAMVRRYDPNVALIEHEYTPQLLRLSKDPGWSLLEVDGAGALFLRRRPENASLAAAADSAFRALDLPISEPDGALLPPALRPRIARWFAPQPFPSEPWGRGSAFWKLGMVRAAWREYRRAVGEGGAEHPALVEDLALICRRLDRRREARAWYELLLRLEPGNPAARQYIGHR